MAVPGTRVVCRLPDWATGVESAPSAIGSINLEVKSSGKRSAGKRHAAFDVAVAGDVTRGAGLRAIAKAGELPPDPTVGAPVLDPTYEGLGVKFPRATHR